MSEDVPAITPHLNAEDSALPAFTAEDASTYVLADYLALVQKFTGRYLHPGGVPTVESVRFMTGAQTDQLFETVTELAPDALVCVVELHGHFYENAGMGPRAKYKENPPPEPIRLEIFQVLYLAFDARTGNFLRFHAPLSSLRLPSRGEPIQMPPGWVPTFTEQDVRDHYQRREYYSSPLPPETSESAIQPVVVSIRYTTMGELDRVCGEKNYFTINYGAGRPIYCVELSGNFPHGHTYFHIVDARNGDHLCTTGIPSRAKWS